MTDEARLEGRARRKPPAVVRAGVAVVLGLAHFAVPSLVEAQEPEETFALRRAPHALIATGLWATALTLDAQKEDWTGTSACAGATFAPSDEDRRLVETEALPLCVRADVFVIDRALQPPFWTGAAPLSDALLLGMVASPFATAGVYELGSQGEFADDGVVAFQTLGATYLATVLGKFLFRRPRPLTYDAKFGSAERSAGDARLSFPSGHTSIAFAAASLIAVMATSRSQGAARVGAVAGAYGAAGFVGYLRVASRRHFFTDALAGAALGTALGWLVPEIHRADDAGSQEGSGFMMSIGGRF